MGVHEGYVHVREVHVRQVCDAAKQGAWCSPPVRFQLTHPRLRLEMVHREREIARWHPP